MSDKRPAIGPDAIVSISREGGVAFFPGLARPRRIRLAACGEKDRQRILALLEAAAALAVPAAGQGDQRYFRIEIRSGPPSKTAVKPLLVPEQDATDELVKLWEEASEA